MTGRGRGRRARGAGASSDDRRTEGTEQSSSPVVAVASGVGATTFGWYAHVRIDRRRSRTATNRSRAGRQARSLALAAGGAHLRVRGAHRGVAVGYAGSARGWRARYEPERPHRETGRVIVRAGPRDTGRTPTANLRGRRGPTARARGRCRRSRDRKSPGRRRDTLGMHERHTAASDGSLSVAGTRTENSKGSAALERGKPTSLVVETLGHAEPVADSAPASRKCVRGGRTAVRSRQEGGVP